MKNEIDILNEKGEFSGEKVDSMIAHKKGLWHAVSHIWFYASNAKVLVQLRAKNHVFYPSLWDISAAGHVDSGEDAFDSAVREIKEELNLNVNREKLEEIFVRKDSSFIPSAGAKWINNEFQHVFLLKWDGDIDSLSLQESEVEKIKFIDLKELEKVIIDREEYKKYVPYDIEYYKKVVSEIKKRI